MPGYSNTYTNTYGGPVALKRQTFDNGTTGVAITAGNSGTSGDAIGTVTSAGTGTATYETTAAIFGAQGARVVGVDTTDTYIMPLTITPAPSASGQIYFRIDTARTPGTAVALFFRFRNASTNVVSALLTTARVLQLTNSAGTGIKNFNATVALPDGIYCLCLQATKGTGTGDGFIAAQLYAENYLTPMDTYSAGNVNAGITDIAQAQAGKCNSAGSCDMDIDEFAIVDATVTPIDVRWDDVHDPEGGPSVAVTRGYRLG